jgi:flagellar hook-associated protein 1 FlgK
MSISGAGYIASSSLMAIQLEISVAAANIANADTAGYTAKTANQSAQVSGGAGAGVDISSITSNVDQLLLKSLISGTSGVGDANSLNNYLDQLQSLYGATTGNTSDGTNSGTSLGDTLAGLESAMLKLSNSPGDASAQAAAVQALNAVASQLSDTSSGIQNLRSNANQDIAASVSDVNQQLKSIDSLNKQISQATASGQSTADLEDQRNSALQDIASQVGISYFKAPNGSVQIYTTSGQALLDNSVHPLSYTPAANVGPSTTYSATPPSGFGGIMLNGQDITSQIGSGAIGALVDLRDTILPGAQSQLDQLANQLESTLNTVHNQGTSVPPPSTLTGATTVTASTPFSGTGTARIAVTDKQGNLVSYQDLDMSQYATVGDLVSAMNAIPGVSASIDQNGHVVVKSTDSSNGIAINGMSSSVGANKQSLSDALGLNNLVTGSGASNFAVRSDILANPGLLATATLDSSATLTIGKSVLGAGSATMANALHDALTGPTSFAAAGGLGAETTSFANFAADIVANVASKASDASNVFNDKQAALTTFSNTMASESGVNVDQEVQLMSDLHNQYTASAQVLQTINEMFASLITAMQTT